MIAGQIFNATTQINDNQYHTTYVVIDYSDEVRFAIPFDEKRMTDLGLNTDLDIQQALKKINETNSNDETAIILNHNCLTKVTKAIQNLGKNNPDRTSFAFVVQHCANKIKKLARSGLPLKQPLCFCFFVRPEPEILGTREASSDFNKHKLNEVYPQSLEVDYDWFKNGYNGMFTNLHIRQLVSCTHELSHIVHSASFGFQDFPPISEGFSEFVPYYLMNMEQLDTSHHQSIADLREKDILTIAFMDEFKLFSLGQPIENHTVQDLRTYQSAYLWVRGYMKKVEDKLKKQNPDTLNATEIKFKAAELVLNELKTIREENNYPQNQYRDIKQRAQKLADLVDMSVEDLFDKKTLQSVGQFDVINTLKEKNITIPNRKETSAEPNPLDMIAKKTDALNKLGTIGLLLINIAPHYLENNASSQLTPPEQNFMDCLDNFRKIFDLTKADAVRFICHKLVQLVDWDVPPQKKQTYLAAVLRVDKKQIEDLLSPTVVSSQNVVTPVSKQNENTTR